MIRFNILGLFGVVIGGLGILGVLWIFSIFKVKDFGLSDGEVFVYIAIIGAFISSVYSFFVDKCEEKKLIKSYSLNITQHLYGSDTYRLPKGFKYNASRRLAFFGLPLSIGPAFLFLIIIFIWIYDLITGNKLASNSEYCRVVSVAFVSAILSLTTANLTKKIRLLPEEKIEKTVEIKHEDYILPRKTTVIFIIISLVMLAINHFFAITSHKVYVSLIFLGPILLSLSIGSAINPRMFYALGPENKKYPLRLKIASILFAVAGPAISLFLYKVVYKL